MSSGQLSVAVKDESELNRRDLLDSTKGTHFFMSFNGSNS